MADDAAARTTAGRPVLGTADVRRPGQGAAGQGPLNWDAARQFAQLRDRRGSRDQRRSGRADRVRRPRPHRRLHVADVTGSTRRPPEPQVVTRGQWAQRTLEAYRPLFTELATVARRHRSSDEHDDAAGDPMMAMMAGLRKMMAPSMMGMAVGSMVGRLATRAFGSTTCRSRAQPATVTLVPSTIDGFAADWEHAGRRDAAVGARPGADRPRPVLGRPRPRHARRDSCASTSAGSAPTRRRRRQARLARRRGRRPDGGDAAGARRSRGAARRRASPEQIALAAAARRGGRRRRRLRRLHGRRGRRCASIGGDALRIAEAVRRRRVEASAERHVRRAPARIRLGDDQVPRGKTFMREWSTGPARRRWRSCSTAPTASRRRPRSTLLVSGWPGSARSADQSRAARRRQAARRDRLAGSARDGARCAGASTSGSGEVDGDADRAMSPTIRKPTRPGIVDHHGDQTGDHPAELEARLELGERPAVVGLRRVALHDRLERRAGRPRRRS